MFCTMFELITIDYIIEHNEYIENPSWDQLERGEIQPMFVQKYCLYMPQLISKPSTACEIFTQIIL